MNSTSMSLQNQTTLSDMLQSSFLKDQIKMAIPAHMKPERMLRIAITELKKTPKLLQCTPATFMSAIIQCSQLGLEPGNNLGHAYLIPYDNKKNNSTECQVIIGYRGMLELAKRSGQIVSIQTQVVYERDFFEFEYGLNPQLRHIPSLSDRGNFKYVYACAILKDGGNQFEVMSNEEVKKIMAQSKYSKFGPWQTHYDEMARKTVIRRLFKYLPISIELTKAIILDESSDKGEQNNNDLLIDLNMDSYIDKNGEIQEEMLEKSKSDLLAESISKNQNELSLENEVVNQ
jgi:recombination protein RecT